MFFLMKQELFLSSSILLYDMIITKVRWWKNYKILIIINK